MAGCAMIGNAADLGVILIAVPSVADAFRVYVRDGACMGSLAETDFPTNAGITVFDPPRREPENHTQGNGEDERRKTEPAAESERIQPSPYWAKGHSPTAGDSRAAQAAPRKPQSTRCARAAGRADTG